MGVMQSMLDRFAAAARDSSGKLALATSPIGPMFGDEISLSETGYMALKQVLDMRTSCNMTSTDGVRDIMLHLNNIRADLDMEFCPPGETKSLETLMMEADVALEGVSFDAPVFDKTR